VWGYIGNNSLILIISQLKINIFGKYFTTLYGSKFYFSVFFAIIYAELLKI